MRILAKKILGIVLGSAAVAIRSFILSVSPPPLGVKSFGKICVDRLIVLQNISIKIIIFFQIRVNREFFFQKKKHFFDFVGDGGGDFW